MNICNLPLWTLPKWLHYVFELSTESLLFSLVYGSDNLFPPPPPHPTPLLVLKFFMFLWWLPAYSFERHYIFFGLCYNFGWSVVSTAQLISKIGFQSNLNYLFLQPISYFNFFFSSSGMIDLRELSLVGGKAAWMAYLVSFICTVYIKFQLSIIDTMHCMVWGTLSLFLLNV